MKIIERFKQLIEEKNYIEVAKLYLMYAYRHQEEFNEILDKNNIKEGIFDIIHKVEGYGEYVDQV
tara:strand:- start:94 stop:288 length:195 start_codon:yes stop_codon:yes gene_type:complete